jgi:carbonic anhydrase
VLRSLIVSIEILGVRTVAVIQHTECGMTKTTNAELRAIVQERRGVEPADIDFLPIDDHAATVHNDVDFLRTNPFLPPDLEVFGFLYDVRTGRLSAV